MAYIYAPTSKRLWLVVIQAREMANADKGAKKKK